MVGDFPEGTASEQDIPRAPDRWHAIAQHLYNSTLKSRQSRYYEPSDYMVLFTTCEQLSRCLKPRYVGTNNETGEPVYSRTPLNGNEMTGLLKALTQLGATLADRRRLEIDIRQHTSSDQDEQAAVTSLDEYRERLRVV